MKKTDILEVLDILENTYPDAECALNHKNVYELIVAVALSAQTTDISVNLITPKLFEKYPDVYALSKANAHDIESIIKTIGLYKSKAKNLLSMANDIVDRFNGEVPESDNDLKSLAGVGQKTANVVMSVGFGHQRLAVDTHVFRVSNRLGIVSEDTPLKTEAAMLKKLPNNRLSKTHHLLIFHGRRCCDARKPKCDKCPVSSYCKYFKKLSKTHKISTKKDF